MSRLRDATLIAQGAFYLLTGLWPILSIETFESVTGPKREDWLVYTVGLLAIVVGASLVFAVASRRVTGSIVVLAAGAAISFAAIDVIYALSDVIPAIYLLEAFVEAGFFVLVVVGHAIAARSPKGRS